MMNLVLDFLQVLVLVADSGATQLECVCQIYIHTCIIYIYIIIFELVDNVVSWSVSCQHNSAPSLDNLLVC